MKPMVGRCDDLQQVFPMTYRRGRLRVGAEGTKGLNGVSFPRGLRHTPPLLRIAQSIFSFNCKAQHRGKPIEAGAQKAR